MKLYAQGRDADLDYSRSESNFFGPGASMISGSGSQNQSIGKLVEERKSCFTENYLVFSVQEKMP